MRKNKKRYSNIFSTLIMCFIMYLVVILLSGCGQSDDTSDESESEEVETTETEEAENINILTSSTGNVLLYFTYDIDEYFKYLNSLDSSVYEVLNIEVSEHLNNSSIEEYYLITYKKVNVPKAEPKGNMYRIYTSNEYFVFIAKDPIQYLDFIDEMNFEKYKILGFSKSGNELKNGNYIITYIEI